MTLLYDHHPSSASWYNVSRSPVVSIEHPCIIRNIEKGVTSFGGSGKLQELTQDRDGSVAKLYLRPGDRMSKPLQSTNVHTNNVLLKITVPKRTGLKRRRGSQDHFSDATKTGARSGSSFEASRLKQASMSKATQCLIRTMRDRPKSYQAHAVGEIVRTHRFRGMPDFVISTVNMPFMKRMQEYILPFNYAKMKGFTLDMSKGVKPDTEIIPPPLMSHFVHPFNYSYRQNPLVKPTVDQLGNATVTNTSESRKILGQSVSFDVPEVPTAPAPSLPQLETLDPAVQRLAASVRRLLEKRPICTRRVIMNLIPVDESDGIAANAFKRVYQYCGYSFTSGPWRDTIVRFGLDPRKDLTYREYQTMMFQLESEPKDNRARYTRLKPDLTRIDPNRRRETHIFDGEHVSKDGKTWQVCDITDPQLKGLLATTNLRSVCHVEYDGWYLNGTWAKAKVIMRAKFQAILKQAPREEDSYAKVLNEMPDIIPQDRSNAKLGTSATAYEMHLATQIRTVASVDRVSSAEKTPSQEDGDHDEAFDPAITMPPRSDEEMIDPRLTEAAAAVGALGTDTSQIESMVDEMDIDAVRD